MIATLLAGTARLLCGCHARWLAPPPPVGPAIYFANHASHLDPLMIWAALPALLRRRTRFVAAADYWQAGPLRRWLAGDIFRAILIERRTVTRRNNPLAALRAALDDGDALVIFPEGGRGNGETLGEFRAGVWHLARRSPDLPLIPVWLENLGRVLPKGELLPIPLITAVRFGPPLHCPDGTRKEVLLERMRAAILTMRESV